jgi:hypothetical protein
VIGLSKKDVRASREEKSVTGGYGDAREELEELEGDTGKHAKDSHVNIPGYPGFVAEWMA